MYNKILCGAALLFFIACNPDKKTGPAEAGNETGSTANPAVKTFTEAEVNAVKKECLDLSADLDASIKAMSAIVEKMPKGDPYVQASDLLENMQGMAEKTVYLKETAGTLEFTSAGGDGQSLTKTASAPVASDQIQTTVAELKTTMESVRETMQEYKKQFEAITGKKVQ